VAGEVAAILEGLRFRPLNFGPLDVLRTIGDGKAYSDLIGHIQEYTVGDLRVRTLRLKMIILSKEQASRDKDRATLQVLRTLDLKTRSE
jgi:hypothetical protein